MKSEGVESLINHKGVNSQEALALHLKRPQLFLT